MNHNCESYASSMWTRKSYDSQLRKLCFEYVFTRNVTGGANLHCSWKRWDRNSDVNPQVLGMLRTLFLEADVDETGALICSS